MENLKGPIASSFKDKDISILAGKLKHLVLSTPLQFSGQALRTHSQSTACFATLSHHCFFSQHGVTHIQGLNGVPICIVNDERSKQTILYPHPMIKSHHTYVFGVPGVQMPIGDPQPFPVPRLSVDSFWREELKELAAGVRAVSSIEIGKKETGEKSQRETRYAEETGRLVPSSSQTITHRLSRRMNQNNGKNKGKAATLPFHDQELIILETALSNLTVRLLDSSPAMATCSWTEG